MSATQLTPNSQPHGRLDSFRRLRKIGEKRLTASSCLSVRMEPLGLHWTNFYKIWYLSIFFRKSVEKIQVSWKWDKKNRHFIKKKYEDLYTFLIVSRPVLLRMRTVSDKMCGENQNTYFIFNNLFPKIVPFMISCGNIWYSQTGHRWQCSMTHALWMLDIWDYRRTLKIYNTYCFSTATMVTRTHLSVTFIHLLPVLLRFPQKVQSRIPILRDSASLGECFLKFLKTSGTNHPPMHCHIPEDRNPQRSCYRMFSYSVPLKCVISVPNITSLTYFWAP